MQKKTKNVSQENSRNLSAIDMSQDPTVLRPGPVSSKKRSEPLINLQHPASMYVAKKSRKKMILVIGGIFFVLLLIGAGAYYAFGRKTSVASVSPSPTEEVKADAPPATTTKPSALTGVLVEPDVAKKPVMASIIENMAGRGGARPQSGLSSAGVVYEALAEGGITRYLALWQADTPQDIGPVRSLRPVFFYSAMEYGAPTAHAGGSTDGLALARDPTFKNVEALANGPFRRLTSRIAPHNLYVYGQKYAELVAGRGWGDVPNFTPWNRKDDTPAQSPNATLITANFSGPDYRAVFRYSASTNSYLREVGGQLDTDAAANNQQINPKVVVIIKATAVAGKQQNGKPKTDIDIIGQGAGYIFQDGTITQITWVKKSATDRMQFLDSVGAPVALNRGQTWVSIVPSTLPPTWQ